MPGLGVGHATQFSQNSDYRTVLNHRFREASAYDPLKQTKVKCPYCGVWARKGYQCTLCGTKIAGQPPQLMLQQRSRSRSPAAGSSRNMTSRAAGVASHTSRGAFADGSTTPRTPGRQGSSFKAADPWQQAPPQTPPASFRRDPIQSATPSMLRGAPSHTPQQQATLKKVKCSYCGVWVQVGKICTLCRTQA